MHFRFLSDLVLVIHLTFILFAILGVILVLKWRFLAWIHVPTFLWAALIEFVGWVCPLTPRPSPLLCALPGVRRLPSTGLLAGEAPGRATAGVAQGQAAPRLYQAGAAGGL